MSFASVGAPRVPRLAVRNAASAMDRILIAARALLLEHARDHVRRHGGQLECPTCREAAGAVHHVDEVLAGDSFR